jgi:predicted MFS family arabinose efflux permease
MVATIQLAITLGAGVGGMVFDSYGLPATFGLSASVLALAALLAFLAATPRTVSMVKPS